MSERQAEKKRILVLANNDVGLYQFRKELLKEMIASGNEVIISLPNGELIESLTAMGCSFVDTPVDRRGINPITDLKLIKNYFSLIKKLKPDLVVTYTIKPNVYGGIVSRLLRVPYAANITGLGTSFQKEGLLKRLVTFMYRVALKKAKVVFFENSENMKTLQLMKICNTENSILLNGAGVNLEHYEYKEFPKNEITHFLFIGRVMKEKGVDELFGAVSRLIADGEDCLLDVVGSFEDNYSEIIENYSAEGWLKYHGQQRDVRPFIEAADCFVLPSWHEGMANTNLESASSGRPIITSNISGCKEAVIDKTTGFLCESKNTDSLYSAMKCFISLSYPEREEMGKQGRRHIEDKFDKKDVVEKTMKGLGL